MVFINNIVFYQLYCLAHAIDQYRYTNPHINRLILIYNTIKIAITIISISSV